jgi:hypothetical protein
MTKRRKGTVFIEHQSSIKVAVSGLLTRTRNSWCESSVLGRNENSPEYAGMMQEQLTGLSS